jgi:DNA-binding NarL/FixJ family response regulator
MFFMNNTRVLIIDGDIEFLAAAAGLLNSLLAEGTVFGAVTRETAETEFLIHNPDLIISDLGFRDIGQILYEAKDGSTHPFILMTSYSENEDYIKLSRRLGADAFCLKENIHQALPELLKYIGKGINFSIIANKYYLLK